MFNFLNEFTPDTYAAISVMVASVSGLVSVLSD